MSTGSTVTADRSLSLPIYGSKAAPTKRLLAALARTATPGTTTASPMGPLTGADGR